METSTALKIGEHIKLFYQETYGVIAKTGTIISFDSVFLKLELDSGPIEILPIARIVRIINFVGSGK